MAVLLDPYPSTDDAVRIEANFSERDSGLVSSRLSLPGKNGSLPYDI